jgi:8-oxo-dGTP pyrophosphatase MutT (NUDIX family)
VRTTLLHLGYRVAYRVLWITSFVVPQRGGGVKCMLLDGGKALVVCHTYGTRRWDFPGGGMRRGEDPLAAMRRELREELGVELAGELRLLGVRGGPGRYAGKQISYYAAQLGADQTIVRDPVEIAEVRWIDPAHPPELLGWNVAEMLARAGESLASAGSDPGSPK